MSGVIGLCGIYSHTEDLALLNAVRVWLRHPCFTRATGSIVLDLRVEARCHTRSRLLNSLHQSIKLFEGLESQDVRILERGTREQEDLEFWRMSR